MATITARAPRGPFKRAMHFVIVRWLAPIARHPVATVLTGVGLALSGTVELVSELVTSFETKVSVYHGVILLGIVTGLRGLADLVEGIDWLSKEAEVVVEEEQHVAVLSNAAKLPPDMA